METRTILPSEIFQTFSALMLSVPAPKLNDDCETLWIIYVYIKDKLIPKTAKYPEWQDKCKKLEKQFLELYERALAKEKETKAKKRHHTQHPLYSIGDFVKNGRKLFTGLKCRSRGFRL